MEITPWPNPGKEIEIELENDVKLQFGGTIERVVREELARFFIEDACIRLVDKGMLDCVIHPRQIDIVNAAFTPTQKEIRQTKRVLQALEEGIRNHTGVVVLDASMVDKPMECRARDILARAAGAIYSRPGVREIDNADYANAYSKGNFLDHLNFGVLGALEVDTDFNVNLLTGSSGRMMGGLGGGPDVAEGADISIVTLPIVRGRTPSVVRRVFTCCTPGETVACVVTQAGIALNPHHRHYGELREDLERAGIKPVTIQELQQLAEEITGVPEPIRTTDRVVAVVEYRDGSVVDVIRETVF